MKYYVVDAFAENIFEGNPAGVCIMEHWISDELMQKIAFENNLSETDLLLKRENVIIFVGLHHSMKLIYVDMPH